MYLDYTGGSLHAESQVREHARLLGEHVYGNPHSANPSSAEIDAPGRAHPRGGPRVFQRRRQLHGRLHAERIGRAQARRARHTRSHREARLLLSADNHNSVNGIREFARARGAAVDYAPLTVPELRFDEPALDRLLAGADPACANLFAFPAQSNFSGVRHPLELVEAGRRRGWRVLLDAAAFVPTNRLDLAAVAPDFVTVSFYKMFGYPTGVGCLLVRNDALDCLHRPWFAGGTVNFATVQGRHHVLSPREAGFEDGTLDYLGIPAVAIGLAHIERIGIETIQTRVRCLTGWLLAELLALPTATAARWSASTDRRRRRCAAAR